MIVGPINPFITFALLVLMGARCFAPSAVQALWLFRDTNSSEQDSNTSTATSSTNGTAILIEKVEEKASEPVSTTTTEAPFTIAGIRPASIASLLNTVSDTGFSYFNVHDQCRSRTACDVGYMLYKKLNFVHNWVIRTSVRSLVDSDNVYAKSWNTGMLGKNCTLIYKQCNQSPLESIMNFAMLAV